MKQKVNIFWFRRDLRLHDNVGLFYALNSRLPVLPIFIFDTTILRKLQNKNDARVTFIYAQVKKLKSQLEEIGSSMAVFYGTPEETFRELIGNYTIQHVFTNKDYEPTAIKRDKEIENLLNAHSVGFSSYKDHVFFDGKEIVKDDGTPYTVFTPYSKKWLKTFKSASYSDYSIAIFQERFIKNQPYQIPGIEDFGFKENNKVPAYNLKDEILEGYAKNRDYPALEGTTRLGIYLRFGVISIREIVKKAAIGSPILLNQLIWRDFFISILWHFPHVKDGAFKPEYNKIGWLNNKIDFHRWCNGETGYRMVDAGMRQLNQTGYMHNRVRMVTASFLTKHLLIDWRWGEAYFAERLLDFELASNNGGWQWAAGTGCDAAPYFRIFNPESQQARFDKEGKYVKQWVPEYGTDKYPQKIVNHAFARERALAAYKNALKK